MSDVEHSFESHALAPVFRRAAFASALQTRTSAVATETIELLARQNNIGLGESAALAYLAAHEVDNFIVDAECEIEMLIHGEAS